MTKLYMTRTYDSKVHEKDFDIISETPSFYTINENGRETRIKKQSTYEILHTTREAAINWIKNRLLSEIIVAEEKITKLKKELESLI